MSEVSSDQHIVDALSESLGVDTEDCKPEADLRRDLGVGSVDSLDIIFRIEQKLRVRVGREDLITNLFDIPLEAYDRKGWAALADVAAQERPARWTTAPGTVGRLQEMARQGIGVARQQA